MSDYEYEGHVTPDRPGRDLEFRQPHHDESPQLRRSVRPHRGDMIMILGILSFFIAGIVLGPMAWIMGNNDLREMALGRMDRSGESNTNVGRICGMISTLIHGVMLVGVLCCFGYFVIMMMLGIGAAASQPPNRQFQPINPPRGPRKFMVPVRELVGPLPLPYLYRAVP
jgi:hypothetical protein